MFFSHLIKDSRSRHCWGHAVDPYFRVGQFLPERFGQTNYTRFRRTIGGCIRIAFLSGDRGDIDNTSVAGLAHRGHNGITAVEYAIEIDFDYPPPFLYRIFPGRRVGPGDSRIVH